MITGYKKRLGHPSEKLSGDIPHANWRAVFFSEIVWLVIMAVISTIAYMFVNSPMVMVINHPALDSYCGDLCWTHCLQRRHTGCLIPRLLILGTYARPHVRFHYGLYRSRPRIGWDDLVL